MKTPNRRQLLNDLERAIAARYAIANHLEIIAQSLEEAEIAGEQTSGQLHLTDDIEDLKSASHHLRQGVFRLLVLGDLKRGKSTFINALLGENLLPSDVNPCTAIVTVLRYGEDKQVTVYFKGERSPEKIGFEQFRQQYTIDPDEAKQLQDQQKLAFPEVNYAVVEYPLPLLQKGLEIIDSPGLNDTEARNQLSLSYINNSHAILFVFRAVQPCTLEERRYLESYLKDRRLAVFFLINAWDEIRKGAIDPDDSQELQEAEEKLRQVFRAHLAPYCQVNGYDLYDERVFELSSLIALRRRLKNADDALEGTGFPQFLEALERFLSEERAVAQFRQATLLARQASQHAHEAIERRLPLLDQDVEQLKRKINDVAPEFEQLAAIRDRFSSEIRQTRDRQVKALTDSCRNYIFDLGNTFEADFVRYQPTLGFLDFLQAGKRDEFKAALQQTFERYYREKLAIWERQAEQELEIAFSQLARSAANYGVSYKQIIDTINEKLIGQKIRLKTDSEEDSPTWAKWAMGFFSLASGNVAGLALAAVGFDWKNILVNWLATISLSSFLLLFLGIPLGIPGLVLTGIGIGTLQAEQARKDFLKAAQKEFFKALPQIAQEQQEVIHQAIRDCFDNYEREVMKRIDSDIQARKAELNNLLHQKENREINRDKELERLRNLDAKLLSEYNTIEATFQNFLTLQT